MPNFIHLAEIYLKVREEQAKLTFSRLQNYRIGIPALTHKKAEFGQLPVLLLNKLV